MDLQNLPELNFLFWGSMAAKYMRMVSGLAPRPDGGLCILLHTLHLKRGDFAYHYKLFSGNRRFSVQIR